MTYGPPARDASYEPDTTTTVNPVTTTTTKMAETRARTGTAAATSISSRPASRRTVRQTTANPHSLRGQMREVTWQTGDVNE